MREKQTFKTLLFCLVHKDDFVLSTAVVSQNTVHVLVVFNLNIKCFDGSLRSLMWQNKLLKAKEKRNRSDLNEVILYE